MLPTLSLLVVLALADDAAAATSATSLMFVVMRVEFALAVAASRSCKKRSIV